VGAAVVVVQPNVYTATAVVRVEPQRPNEEMVQRTVSELVEQRLLTVRQELMARPVLQKAIEEMKLYPDIVKEHGLEAAITRMRKDMEVKVEGENAFEITYSSRDPKVAAQVANRLPTLFADETLKLRQSQAERATELFRGEVDNLKATVSSWEQKIAQFKVDHMGELPEQLEMNMRGLERISGLMQMKSEELRVAEGRRSDIARAHHSADSEAGRLQAAENGLTRSLVEAKTTWTEDHPEVKRLENELGSMKSQREEAEGRLTSEKQERGRSTTMVGQIQQEMVDLQKQAEAYQARLDTTPRWAHELGVLNRDYEVAKAKYQSVVSRKVEAEIAQELEVKSSKSLFNVISPASVPGVPAKPDRLGGLLIAALAALGLGVLAGVVLEMRDDSIRDSNEVRERISLPVLAVVPNMHGKTEKRVLLPPPAGRAEITSPSSSSVS